ncbi:MAG: CoA-binding protein [Chloroflexi bacterium]|nr:CoA-binding protein [Chloroflexota bacterium]
MDRIKLFFEPKSVVLVGATDRAGSVGQTTLENLLLSKDKRKVYPINPNREQIMDTMCYPNLSALPEVPELAIIATAAESVPDMVEECGKNQGGYYYFGWVQRSRGKGEGTGSKDY